MGGDGRGLLVVSDFLFPLNEHRERGGEGRGGEGRRGEGRGGEGRSKLGQHYVSGPRSAM